jgi:hypothetical protein
MVTTLPPKTEPCELQQAIEDRAFWVEIRRGLLIIARAIAKRSPRWRGILLIFGEGN